jgi:6-phosphofructokinase 2
VHVAGDTREDFTVVDRQTGEQYRFVLPGPRLSEAEQRKCLEALGSCGRPAYIVASGSLPPGVPDDFYASAARTAKSAGAMFVLDTSGPPLKAALEEGVHLVKPNLRELSDMVGETLDHESSWVEAARKLVEAGRAEIVALSLGHRGALLVTGDQAWRAEPLEVKIVSAVGAGDSFLGAMIWSLASGHSLDKGFRYAVAAGSAALLTPGTDLARAEDVKRLYDDVRMKQL